LIVAVLALLFGDNWIGRIGTSSPPVEQPAVEQTPDLVSTGDIESAARGDRGNGFAQPASPPDLEVAPQAKSSENAGAKAAPSQVLAAAGGDNELLPDQAELVALLRGTLRAVSSGMKTGDYSRLLESATADFARHNSERRLQRVFSAGGVWDSGQTDAAPPNFEFPPTLTDGVLRMRGAFVLEQGVLQFDTLYRHSAGGWKLHGVAVKYMNARQ
jgi:hypothetical protein